MGKIGRSVLLVVLLSGIFSSWDLRANCQQLANKLIGNLEQGAAPDLAALEQLLIARSKLGEVTHQEVSGLMAAVARADSVLGHSVMGSDVPACLQNFSPEAIQAFVKLFSQLGEIKGEGEVLSSLQAQAKKVFAESDLQARQRICAFTGVNPGLKCQILNNRYASSCR